MDFPMIDDLTVALKALRTWWSHHGTEEFLDVRLQVVEGEGWCLRLGNVNEDRRGWWGYGVLSKDSNCRELACDLVEEARTAQLCELVNLD